MAIETERKFLIRYPSCEVLSKALPSEIEQIYLTPEEGSEFDNERIRKRVYYDGGVVYTNTKKRRITKVSAIEDEVEISAEDYGEKKARIEKGTNILNKTRYVLPYRGLDFEIDVYDFWNDRAVMEVELPSEDTDFLFPENIEVIKELTGNKKYSNHALSKSVPREEI